MALPPGGRLPALDGELVADEAGAPVVVDAVRVGYAHVEAAPRASSAIRASALARKAVASG